MPQDNSSSMEEQETDDDEFQVVQSRRGKSKTKRSNMPSPIVTRNASKAKAAQKIKGDDAKGSCKCGGGAPQGSSLGNT